MSFFIKFIIGLMSSGILATSVMASNSDYSGENDFREILEHCEELVESEQFQEVIEWNIAKLFYCDSLVEKNGATVIALKMSKFLLTTNSERSLLTLAVMGGSSNFLKQILLFLNSDVVMQLLNLPDYFGMTPLMHAASIGNFEMVDLLIQLGHANLDTTNNYGLTALFYAAKNPEMIMLLLLKGANPLHGAALQGPNQPLQVLMAATETGNHVLVNHILDNSPDLIAYLPSESGE